MAWTSPRTWVSSEVVTAALLNTHVKDNLTFLKSGVALTTNGTASVGPTSGTTELVVATAPAFTADGSTVVEVSFSWYNITQTTAADVFLIRLYDGTTPGSGTQIAQWLNSGAGTTTVYGSGHARAVITPTAGAHTYTARLVRSSGAGTATMAASSTTPAVITVCQVN